jgi:hypothetical protein
VAHSTPHVLIFAWTFPRLPIFSPLTSIFLLPFLFLPYCCISFRQVQKGQCICVDYNEAVAFFHTSTFRHTYRICRALR